MIAIVSVELSSNDAHVVGVMDDELLEDAIEIVRERNKKFIRHHCYVQQNVRYERFRTK